MQLGPVLRSKQAKTFGLDLSLLERLIYSDLYARDEKKFSDHGSYDPLLASLFILNLKPHPETKGRQTPPPPTVDRQTPVKT